MRFDAGMHNHVCKHIELMMESFSAIRTNELFWVRMRFHMSSQIAISCQFLAANFARQTASIVILCYVSPEIWQMIDNALANITLECAWIASFRLLTGLPRRFPVLERSFSCGQFIRLGRGWLDPSFLLLDWSRTVFKFDFHALNHLHFSIVAISCFIILRIICPIWRVGGICTRATNWLRCPDSYIIFF